MKNTRLSLSIGALAWLMLASLISSCTYSGDIAGVYTYAGAGVRECEGQPLPERTITPPPTFTPSLPIPTQEIATVTPVPTMCTVNTGVGLRLNVRDRASLSGEVVGSLERGTTFEKGATSEDGRWLQVWLNGSQAWVAAWLVVCG